MSKAKTIQEACDLYAEVRDKYFSLKKAKSLGFNEQQIMHFCMFNMLQEYHWDGVKQWKFKQNPALLLIERERPDGLRVLYNRLNELKYAHN